MIQGHPRKERSHSMTDEAAFFHQVRALVHQSRTDPAPYVGGDHPVEETALRPGPGPRAPAPADAGALPVWESHVRYHGTRAGAGHPRVPPAPRPRSGPRARAAPRAVVAASDDGAAFVQAARPAGSEPPY